MEVQYDMKTVTNEQALNVLSKMEKSLQTQLDIAKSKASPEQRKRFFLKNLRTALIQAENVVALV